MTRIDGNPDSWEALQEPPDDYHDQPNGFHDAEDYTAIEGIQEMVDVAQEGGFYDDPRIYQNQRYLDIQTAADLIWRILETHSVGGTVGTAFSDIRDRIKWSAETGQGLEDLV